MKARLTTQLTLLFAAVLSLMATGSASAIERQEATNWCWAACIQDVAADEGMRLDQDDIVTRLYGGVVDQPASTHHVVQLLQSYNMGANLATRPPVNAQELYGSLQQGYRFIALIYPQGGAVGHFVVISDFFQDGSLIVEDPMDGRTHRMSPQQVFSYNWIQTIVVHP